MSYRIKVTKRFEKDFKKFRKKSIFLEKIKKMEKEPHCGKRLHGQLKGKHSLRVGNYRIICKIDDDQKEIILYTILHRKRAYKKK
ncbi:MAG: type II toxin-antitoxin system RelE/ParE family toxin [Thermoplasmata archaeon]|nr:type II toxin-antitoxin system RelE/ParE family toxin [Thermoplasmata archaeon]